VRKSGLIELLLGLGLMSIVTPVLVRVPATRGRWRSPFARCEEVRK
jgi:hypothetical protein